MNSWRCVTASCTCTLFLPGVFFFLGVSASALKTFPTTIKRQHDSKKLCSSGMFPPSIHRKGSCWEYFCSFLIFLCSVWSSLSRSDLIPVLEHLWVTEEPWFKPVKRGGKVAAASSAACVYSAHILMWWCVSQRSCPVSEVNQMRQMECFLCRC